jgi:hypothetical protein
MKFIFVLPLVFFLFLSCKKETTTQSNNSTSSNITNKLEGVFPALISAGVKKDIECSVEIVTNGTQRSISISGSEISPTIKLTGVYDSSLNKIYIDKCINKCYNGYKNVASGGFVEIIGNKIYIKYGVWDPEYDTDEYDAMDYIVVGK